MDEVRPFAPPGSLPFIITVGRDQAAPPLDRVLESRFFQNRLGTGIDLQRKFTGVLDPGGQQAPAHQTKMPGIVLDYDHRDWLCRRDLMPGPEIRVIDIAKNLRKSSRLPWEYGTP